MTKANVLASVLYRLAISLKNQDFKKLIFKRHRKDLIYTLSSMKFLTHCIGMKSISPYQAEKIVNLLKDTNNIDTDALAESLKEASDESDFSVDYENLLSEMQQILSSCIDILLQKKKGYIDRINLYIKAFHNYPRAFLSLTDKSRISPEQATEYSKPYLIN